MTTCCPNCSSPSAMGTDVVSLCSECASVSVAGASISIPAIIVAATLAVTVSAGLLLVRKWRASRPACA